jgi:hypothetical protein
MAAREVAQRVNAANQNCELAVPKNHFDSVIKFRAAESSIFFN